MKRNRASKIKRYDVLRLPLSKVVKSGISSSYIAESPAAAADAYFNEIYREAIDAGYLSIIYVIPLCRADYWDFDYVFVVEKPMPGPDIPISESLRVYLGNQPF